MLSILALVCCAILLINLGAFAAFGFDKAQSRGTGWRISERWLLALAMVGGWLGAKTGQYYFRHKTHKYSFKSKLNAIPFLYAFAGMAVFIVLLLTR